MAKVNGMWRTMVYVYGVHFASAARIIMMLNEGQTQDQIEAALPKEDARCFVRYSFNNRIECQEQANGKT